MRGQGAVGSWIEGMAAICFFILCLSQWVLVFGISDQISRQSQDFNQAVILAESVAEIWKAWGTEGVVEKLGFSEEENENDQKEKEGYIRLSIDEEMWKAYGRKGVDYPDSQYEELSEQTESILRDKLIALIKDGKNAVIDFSFWNKENRKTYKSIIEKHGGEAELIYMKADIETLRKRLKKRNLHLNANSPFIITDEILEHHYHGFQEPCGEGEIVCLQQ